jgi:uncharacterized SAM-binding protein YcdF (DUF218 family)
MPFSMLPTELAFLKPWLTALAMPPALGLLLIGLGILLLLVRSRRRLGIFTITLGMAFTWLVSCNGFAVWMGRHWLPQVANIVLPTASQTLRQQKVQAIIVLGGGVESRSREYGRAQPNGSTMARIQYGAVLARSTGLPLGFSGGQGRAADKRSEPEAQSVQTWLSQLGLPPLRWAESQSRDTLENAQFTAALLRKDGVQRIALVTHAWHMPRAQRAFERAGLTVLPAPMGYTEPQYSPGLEWLPSEEGLRNSRAILRELLGTALAQ